MNNTDKSIKDIYIEYWKNYVNFKGVSTRKEYWIPTLINLVIYFILAFLTIMSFTLFGINSISGNICGSIFGILFIIFALGNFIPSYAVYFRRFRDAGRHWITALVLVIATLIINTIINFNEENYILVTFLAIILLILGIYQLIITLLPTCENNKQKWI